MYSVANRRVVFSQARWSESGRWPEDLGLLLKARNGTLERVWGGAETVRRVEHGGIDLALLSADPPWIDGLGLLEVVRSIDAGLACVLVTRTASPGFLRRARALGAYSVVTHPVNPAAVLDLIGVAFGAGPGENICPARVESKLV